MAWRALDVVRPGTPAGARAAPVTLSIAIRARPRLMITMQPAAMPPGWQVGDHVAATMGHGEHAGMLRLALDPRGAHRLCRYGARSPQVEAGRVSVAIVLADSFDLSPHEPAPVEARIDGEALIVTLPRWAQPRLRAQVVATVVPARGGKA